MIDRSRQAKVGRLNWKLNSKMKKLSKRAKDRIVKALNDIKFELAKCEHEDAWTMMEKLSQVEKDVKYIGEPRKIKKKIKKKKR